MEELPSKIGPYKILRKIGAGGMGAVYEGVHELIERKVAIKVLLSEHAKQPEFISRFFNEARVVNRIDHPGLCQVSDYGQLPDNTAYIVMELLQGETLSARIKKAGGPLSLDQVLSFGAQVSEALEAAHQKGIIHRDLKPDNVMIVPDARVPGGERTKLLDFGIAKLTDDNDPASAKTNANAMMGTIYYMSPEQCQGAGKVDHRSDVYSLGVMLYEMLCGERPHIGEGQGEILVKHVTEEPVPLLTKAPQVPPAVAELVHRMLTKNKEQRPTMAEVAPQLEALSAEYPPPVKRRNTLSTQLPIVTLPAPTPTNPNLKSFSTNTAAGQTAPPGQRRRNIGLIAAAGVALPVLGGLTWYLGHHKHTPDSTQSATTAPPVHNTHLSIDSSPPGAYVVQVATGQVLGKTPWVQERPAEQGMLKLRLNLSGYTPKELELDQSRDATIKETLSPMPSPAPPAEESDDSGAKTKKPSKHAAKGAADSGKKKHKSGQKKTAKGGRLIED